VKKTSTAFGIDIDFIRFVHYPIMVISFVIFYAAAVLIFIWAVTMKYNYPKDSIYDGKVCRTCRRTKKLVLKKSYFSFIGAYCVLC